MSRKRSPPRSRGAATRSTASRRWRTPRYPAVNDYEVVILDINLPDGEGTEVLRSLRRQRRPTPVLMLTARMAVEDRVAALDIGADDYLVKPFDLRELQARVRALGRRSGPDRSGIIEFGRLALDPAGRVATCDGAPLSLTRREFSLLEALMANRTRIMPKERLSIACSRWTTRRSG